MTALFLIAAAVLVFLAGAAFGIWIPLADWLRRPPPIPGYDSKWQIVSKVETLFRANPAGPAQDALRSAQLRLMLDKSEPRA